MGDGKDSDFDPDLKKESSVENLVTLRGSRASIIGDIKRLINKIDEKLSLNGHSEFLQISSELQNGHFLAAHGWRREDLPSQKSVTHIL